MTVTVAPAVPTSTPTPCVGACRIEPATGWCRGCWRTRDEIHDWAMASEARKKAILSRTAKRRADKAR